MDKLKFDMRFYRPFRTCLHFSLYDFSVADTDSNSPSSLLLSRSGTKWSVFCTQLCESIIILSCSRTCVAVSLFSGLICNKPLIICSVAFDISQFLLKSISNKKVLDYHKKWKWWTMSCRIGFDYSHWNGIFGRFDFLEQCRRRRFEEWELATEQHVEYNA